MKKLLISALSIVLLLSCSQDQKAVKKLDGIWNASKWEVTDGGLTVDLIELGGSAEITFENCELKDDSYCNYTSYTQLLEVYDTIVGTYRVAESGTVLKIKDANGTITNSSQILELTNDFLRLKEVNGSQAVVVEANKE